MKKQKHTLLKAFWRQRALARSAALAAVAAVFWFPAFGQSTVNVDDTNEHQRIEGFGAFGGKRVSWSGNPPHWTTEFIEDTLLDLGMTISRSNVGHTLEEANFTDGNDPDCPYPYGDLATTADYMPSNDDGDPRGGIVWDSDHFSLSRSIGSTGGQDCYAGGVIDYWFDYKIDQMTVANANGVPLKFIVSNWSPPPWMKYQECIWTNDHYWGRLSDGMQGGKPDMYEEYAEFCVAFIKGFKSYTGYDIYAFSFQNEPYFTEPYASCVYSHEQYARMTQFLGERFDWSAVNETPFTAPKLFGPEDLSDMARVWGYMLEVCDNPDIEPHLDILAVHGYAADGVTAGDIGPTNWSDTHKLARRYNKPLWMTETSGYYDDWENGEYDGDPENGDERGAFALSWGLFNMLRYGRGAAWVWWQLSQEGGNEFSLMDDGVPMKRYYVSKQFYRFVRPGAVCIETNSGGDDELSTLAFKDEGNQTLTVIILNLATTSKNVELSGIIEDESRAPASMELYTTDAATDCAQSTVTDPFTTPFSIPARSVNTLVADPFDPADTVLEAPVIMTSPENGQPQDVTTIAGQSATFEVIIKGIYPYENNIQFQWQENGADIPGAVYSFYTKKNCQEGDSGNTYRCVITNDYGTTNSDEATLTVEPFNGLTIAYAPSDRTPLIDGAVDEIWTKTASVNMQYTWVDQEAFTDPVDLDCQSEFKCLWDENYLYYYVSTTDYSDSRRAPLSGAGPDLWGDGSSHHFNDSVELYVDYNNSKGSGSYDADDWQWRAAYNSLPDNPEVNTWKGPGNGNVGDACLEGVIYDYADRANGWLFEMAVPWSYLAESSADPYPPSAGKFIGIECHYNDCDGLTNSSPPPDYLRSGKRTWWDDQDLSWRDPVLWGTGFLLETPPGVLSIVTPADLPDATQGEYYNTQMNAVEGQEPYTWSIIAGSPPDGLSMVEDSGEYYIRGTPTAAGGPAYFTVQVTDTTSPTMQVDTKEMNITVVEPDPLAINTTTLDAGERKQPYSDSLTASGGIKPYSWAVVSGSLPSGLTLDSGTGEISGTPASAGTSAFTAQVTDNNSETATKGLSITINPGPDITVTTTATDLQIGFPTVNGKLYRLMRNTSTPELNDSGWTATGDELTGDGNPASFTVPKPASGKVFYTVEY